MSPEQAGTLREPLTHVNRYLAAMRTTNAADYQRVTGILDPILFNQKYQTTREVHTRAILDSLAGYRADQRVVRGRRVGAVLHVLHGAIVGNHVDQKLLKPISRSVRGTLVYIRNNEDIELPTPNSTITDLLTTIVTVENTVKGGESDAIINRAHLVDEALGLNAFAPQQ